MELIVEDAEFVTMAPGGGAGSMLVRDGRIAAITVLDRNPLTTDPEQITAIQVLATVVDGMPTYQAGTVSFPDGRPAG